MSLSISPVQPGAWRGSIRELGDGDAQVVVSGDRGERGHVGEAWALHREGPGWVQLAEHRHGAVLSLDVDDSSLAEGAGRSRYVSMREVFSGAPNSLAVFV
jgi:hypothetical protein